MCKAGSDSSLGIKNMIKGRAAPFPSLGLWPLREETGPPGWRGVVPPWLESVSCETPWRLGAKSVPSQSWPLQGPGCLHPHPTWHQKRGAWETVHSGWRRSRVKQAALHFPEVDFSCNDPRISHNGHSVINELPNLT